MANIHKITTIEEVLSINPDKIDWILHWKELLQIAKVLNCIWSFNYLAQQQGLFGCHAHLTSDLHSDYFFNAEEMLKYDNIRMLVARQFAFKFSRLGIARPDWVAGIPKGATELAKDLAELLEAKCAELEKREDQIFFNSQISNFETLIWVQDVLTEGTSIKQAYTDLAKKSSIPVAFFYVLTLVNRSGLESIDLDDEKKIKIVPLLVATAKNWHEKECPLCPNSIALKPNETPQNWDLLTNSQKITK